MRTPRLIVVLAFASFIGCGKKPTAAPAPAEPATSAPDAAQETPKSSPIVTPTSVDEMAQRIFEAVQAKDLKRMVGYRPSDTFIDRLCPEQSPQMRSAYADILAKSASGVENRAAECDAINWNGASLTRVVQKKEGLAFYGCEPVRESSFEIDVTLKAGNVVTIAVPTIFLANGGVYLGAIPRCPIVSPCGDLVTHLEELIKADPNAKLKPLDGDTKVSVVAWCEGFYDDPSQKERIDCFRQAKSYEALANCPASVTEVFKMWPTK